MTGIRSSLGREQPHALYRVVGCEGIDRHDPRKCEDRQGRDNWLMRRHRARCRRWRQDAGLALRQHHPRSPDREGDELLVLPAKSTLTSEWEIALGATLYSPRRRGLV